MRVLFCALFRPRSCHWRITRCGRHPRGEGIMIINFSIIIIIIILTTGLLIWSIFSFLSPWTWLETCGVTPCPRSAGERTTRSWWATTTTSSRMSTASLPASPSPLSVRPIPASMPSWSRISTGRRLARLLSACTTQRKRRARRRRRDNETWWKDLGGEEEPPESVGFFLNPGRWKAV